MTPTGFKRPANSNGKTQGEQPRSAPNSAFSDDLQRLIDRWPDLPERVRREILAIVDSAPDALGNAKDAPGRDGRRRAGQPLGRGKDGYPRAGGNSCPLPWSAFTSLLPDAAEMLSHVQIAALRSASQADELALQARARAQIVHALAKAERSGRKRGSIAAGDISKMTASAVPVATGCADDRRGNWVRLPSQLPPSSRSR